MTPPAAWSTATTNGPQKHHRLTQAQQASSQGWLERKKKTAPPQLPAHAANATKQAQSLVFLGTPPPQQTISGKQQLRAPFRMERRSSLAPRECNSSGPELNSRLW
ncbi:hypothetical protein CEP53_009448 [Fusarium sp. AF-6]|nr:hypothetical protein CEP53_009448 [Fusarium sp. AF-6]